MRFRERGKNQKARAGEAIYPQRCGRPGQPLRGPGPKLKGARSGTMYPGLRTRPVIGPKPFSRATGFVQDTRRDF